VHVTHGAVYDVAVDVRRSSSTFGRGASVELSGKNHRPPWIPEGMAYGFLVLSEWADFRYKTSGYYTPAAEGASYPHNPPVRINWPLCGLMPVLTANDAAVPAWSSCTKFE